MSRAAVHFGAGNIGRGLVGWLLTGAGIPVTFVDADRGLLDRLREAGRYNVRILGPSGVKVEDVDRFTVLDAADNAAVVEAIAQASIVTTAVGVPVLPAVAPSIAAGLGAAPNRSVNVMACENAVPNSGRLRDLVAEIDPTAVEWAGFPEVMVDRLIPGIAGEDELDVVVEDHFDFLVERPGWVGPPLAVDGIQYVDDFDAYRLRKLWLVNGLHAAAAYLGLEQGHAYMHEAVADPGIRPVLEAAAGEMAEVLARLHPELSRESVLDYGRRALTRFANPAIPDPLRRVARDPLRKLGVGERLLRPAMLAVETDGAAPGLAASVAAGLRLRDAEVEGVQALAERVEQRGWRTVLIESGVEPDHPVLEEVASKMTEGVGR